MLVHIYFTYVKYKHIFIYRISSVNFNSQENCCFRKFKKINVTSINQWFLNPVFFPFFYIYINKQHNNTFWHCKYLKWCWKNCCFFTLFKITFSPWKFEIRYMYCIYIIHKAIGQFFWIHPFFMNIFFYIK